ncbi:unnamed protein product [Protopolystoma xenopodis]|uniref:Uncharacterized protein n=1 Tax=Protopolystoma xenopodis TaxID=117903 RepID=A0A448WJL1_9PLAT|nr:unnamed protein product [Protopolystoma xenopodis]
MSSQGGSGGSSSILGPASLLSGSPSISGVGVLSAGTGVSGIGATGAGLTRVFGDRSYLADPRFRRRRIATVTSPTPASSRDAETNETSSDELKMLSKVNDFGLDASASSLSSLSPTLPNKDCSSATQTSTSDNPTGLNYSSGSSAVSVVR